MKQNGMKTGKMGHARVVSIATQYDLLGNHAKHVFLPGLYLTHDDVTAMTMPQHLAMASGCCLTTHHTAGHTILTAPEHTS